MNIVKGQFSEILKTLIAVAVLVETNSKIFQFSTSRDWRQAILSGLNLTLQHEGEDHKKPEEGQILNSTGGNPAKFQLQGQEAIMVTPFPPWHPLTFKRLH